jgi:NhaP-type Na+/H+ or K+/H+ antiporter
MSEGSLNRGKGFVLICLGIAAAASAFTSFHGRPAFLVGIAGGVLLGFGIATLFRK